MSMSSFQTSSELDSELQGSPPGHWFGQVIEGLPVYELRDDVRDIIEIANAKDGYNIGMGYPRSGASFLHDTRSGRRIGIHSPDEFHRDMSIEESIMSEIHIAHTATTNLAYQVIFTDA